MMAAVRPGLAQLAKLGTVNLCLTQLSTGEINMDERFEAGIDENSSNDVGLQVYDAIPHYSEQEAQVLTERLAKEESFREALQVLIVWLEKGECNRNNYATFFSLIKLCFNNVQRLKLEQEECLEEDEKAEKKLADQNCLIQSELNKIENSFKLVEKHKIWPKFTEIEKEKIQEMKKRFLDLWMICLGKTFEEEISNNFKTISNHLNKVVLLELIDFLALKINTMYKKKEDLEAICESYANERLKLNRELIMNAQDERTENFASRNELCIIFLVRNLLSDDLSGVSLYDICSYLNKRVPPINVRELELLLKKNPEIFEEVGFGQEKKWIYIDY